MTKEKEVSTVPAIPTTDAGKLWTKIKDSKLNVFGLDGQVVSKYFEPVFVDNTNLHLKYTVPASIPAIEEVLGNQYKVEQAQMGGMKMLVVSPDPAVSISSTAHVMIGSK